MLFKLDGDLPHRPDSDLVFVDGPYLEAAYADSVAPRFRLVPPHNYGPPEHCYFTEISDLPGLTVNTYGQGRAIYIPWSPGALYHRQGYANTAAFAADVRGPIAGLQAVAGNLPPMVEVTLYQQAGGAHRLLHLVNGSGHFGVSFFDPVPLRDLEIRVPHPRQPTRVECLVGGAPCPCAWQDGELTLRLDALDLFEAIKIS